MSSVVSAVSCRCAKDLGVAADCPTLCRRLAVGPEAWIAAVGVRVGWTSSTSKGSSCAGHRAKLRASRVRERAGGSSKGFISASWTASMHSSAVAWSRCRGDCAGGNRKVQRSVETKEFKNKMRLMCSASSGILASHEPLSNPHARSAVCLIVFPIRCRLLSSLLNASAIRPVHMSAS